LNQFAFSLELSYSWPFLQCSQTFYSYCQVVCKVAGVRRACHTKSISRRGMIFADDALSLPPDRRGHNINCAASGVAAISLRSNTCPCWRARETLWHVEVPRLSKSVSRSCSIGRPGTIITRYRGAPWRTIPLSSCRCLFCIIMIKITNNMIIHFLDFYKSNLCEL
jgi:hypothetical protein